MGQLLVHFRVIHFPVHVLCRRYKQCQNGTVQSYGWFMIEASLRVHQLIPEYQRIAI